MINISSTSRQDVRHKLILLTIVLCIVLLWILYFARITGSDTLHALERPGNVGSTMAARNTVIVPKVILYGDSITQQSFSKEGRWGALLSNHLIRKCDVVNRGFSGYTSRWNLLMLHRFFSPADAPHIAAMTLFLGANDSTMKAPSNHQHVPLDEFSHNIRKMVTELIAMGIDKKKIIIIGTPPVDEERHSQNGWPAKKDNKVCGEYSRAAEKVAQETGAHFIELYDSMMMDQDWKKLYLRDGLHFSGEGSKFLFNKLMPVIEELTHKLPMIMPHYNSLRSHPEKLLS